MALSQFLKRGKAYGQKIILVLTIFTGGNGAKSYPFLLILGGFLLWEME